MIILSVESSCDETAVALVRDGREVLTDQVFSQADLHAVYGGVVPEIASRSHIEVIYQLADRALSVAGLTRADIDAVAVTFAPGLIGALLVGVNFAKSLAFGLGVPLIPVHHIRGHIAANYLAFPELEPPFLCLAISGGNTLIADVRDYTDIRVLGSTRDDAAGECFDKTARVLGLPYPGGKPLDDLSRGGDDSKYHMPQSHVEGNPPRHELLRPQDCRHQPRPRSGAARRGARPRLACRELYPRREREPRPAHDGSLKELGYDKLAVAGGVAANSRIRRDFAEAAEKAGAKLFIPPLKLCGDNAAMIGAQGYYEYLAGNTAGAELNAYATLEV